MEKVYVPVNPHEKAMQRALIQYRNPKNYDLVAEALKIAGRTDLIGFDKKCLIKPRNLIRALMMRKSFVDMGEFPAARMRLAGMKTAGMEITGIQQEKILVEEIQAQAAEIWKSCQEAR